MDGFGELLRGLGEMLGGIGEFGGERAAEAIADGGIGAFAGENSEGYDATSSVTRYLAGGPKALGVNDL